jgi:hypothetical protein
MPQTTSTRYQGIKVFRSAKLFGKPAKNTNFGGEDFAVF